MLTDVLQWIDGPQLFAVLLEYLPQQDAEAVPATRPPALSDQLLLKRLLPDGLYRTLMQTGWVGMHALSFALRHRVTQLHLLFHESYQAVDSGLQQSLLEAWSQKYGQAYRPLFGFSPLGVHSSMRGRGLCRAFDALSLWSCTTATTQIFCPAHEAEAFWIHSRGGSQQALMYHYYAQLEHFSLYGEAELQRLLTAFWQRYQTLAPHELAEALQYFGLLNEEVLRTCGLVQLRRLFLQFSLQHHPDRGGDENAFVLLQKHYHRLKRYLELA